jgi:hypothetical protein
MGHLLERTGEAGLRASEPLVPGWPARLNVAGEARRGLWRWRASRTVTAQAGCAPTIAPKTRTCRSAGVSGRCSGSNPRGGPTDSAPSHAALYNTFNTRPRLIRRPTLHLFRVGVHQTWLLPRPPPDRQVGRGALRHAPVKLTKQQDHVALHQGRAVNWGNRFSWPHSRASRRPRSSRRKAREEGRVTAVPPAVLHLGSDRPRVGPHLEGFHPGWAASKASNPTSTTRLPRGDRTRL